VRRPPVASEYMQTVCGTILRGRLDTGQTPVAAAADHPALDHVIASYSARATRREDVEDVDDRGGAQSAGGVQEGTA